MKIFIKKDGFGTIEAVILIAIVIGLAVIFREYVIRFVEMIFDAIFEDAEEIIASIGFAGGN